MIEEPMCLGYSRDSKPDSGGQYHTRRHLQEVVNTICPGRRETNEILIIEPDKTMEQTEPTIQNIGNIYPSGGQGGKVVAPTGLAPAVCECHGEVTRVVEQQISAHPLSHAHENPTPKADVSPTLRATDYKAPHCVYETVIASTQEHAYKGSVDKTSPCLTEAMGTSGTNTPMVTQRTIAYKEMPNGNIRAYDPNTPDKRGISESQITNPNNEAPTVTTAHEPKIMEQQTMYRIRKLTPRECYRLMDVDDSDIDKLLMPTDEKGKPIIPKSQHYKLAGNSIVVSPLYHIFRKMFVDTTPTQPIQLTLF